MGPDEWVTFLPAFAVWAEGRVADAAALLDRFDGVTLASDGHAVRLGKLNLAMGRVQAAQRAFRQMSIMAEREAFLGGPRREWPIGELAAPQGDDAPALRELERLVEHVRPGDFRYVLAVEAISRLFERRGDLPPAAAALRRLDGVQRAAYAVSGMHGFEWLLARAHWLELERRLGHTGVADAIARDLERWRERPAKAVKSIGVTTDPLSGPSRKTPPRDKAAANMMAIGLFLAVGGLIYFWSALQLYMGWSEIASFSETHFAHNVPEELWTAQDLGKMLALASALFVPGAVLAAFGVRRMLRVSTTKH